MNQTVLNLTSLNDSIRESIYTIMGAGQQSMLEDYLDRARKLEGIKGMYIIRSPSLEAEVGKSKYTALKDDLDQHVLESG